MASVRDSMIVRQISGLTCHWEKEEGGKVGGARHYNRPELGPRRRPSSMILIVAFMAPLLHPTDAPRHAPALIVPI